MDAARRRFTRERKLPEPASLGVPSALAPSRPPAPADAERASSGPYIRPVSSGSMSATDFAGVRRESAGRASRRRAGESARTSRSAVTSPGARHRCVIAQRICGSACSRPGDIERSNANVLLDEQAERRRVAARECRGDCRFQISPPSSRAVRTAGAEQREGHEVSEPRRTIRHCHYAPPRLGLHAIERAPDRALDGIDRVSNGGAVIVDPPPRPRCSRAARDDLDGTALRGRALLGTGDILEPHGDPLDGRGELAELEAGARGDVVPQLLIHLDPLRARTASGVSGAVVRPRSLRGVWLAFTPIGARRVGLERSVRAIAASSGNCVND
jgi:hypothetical protein